MQPEILPSNLAHLGDLQSTSMNFPYGWVTFRQLPSTFQLAGRSSVHSRQISMWPGGLLSTSVNFPSGQKTFGQLPCDRETFRQLSARFCATGRSSVNFCQLSKGRSTFCQHPSIFLRLVNLPKTFCNFPCGWEICEIWSTFNTAGRTSVHIRPLSMQPEDLPSICVNIPCGLETFRKLLSISVWPEDPPSTSVNFLSGLMTI